MRYFVTFENSKGSKIGESIVAENDKALMQTISELGSILANNWKCDFEWTEISKIKINNKQR